MLRAVIVSAIFGVCSSGGQSEEVVRQFCESIKDEFPDVAKLLLEKRYVDDIMNSKKNKVDVHNVIQKTEEVLKKIDMKIKGWTVSGENPPEELTDDGVSIGFSGISWFPVISV